MKTKTIFGTQKEQQAKDILKEMRLPKQGILFEKEDGQPFAAWSPDGYGGGKLITESEIKKFVKTKKSLKEPVDLSVFTQSHRYADAADAFDKFMRVMRVRYED